MRVGTVLVLISFICFFLSIYFAMFPLFVTVDEQSKAHFLALANSFFVGGMVLIVLFAVAKISGRVSSEKNERL